MDSTKSRNKQHTPLENNNSAQNLILGKEAEMKTAINNKLSLSLRTK